MSGSRGPLSVCLVTPNYNGADYLAECLDSIAAQAYPALEHVVVDGASTDESLLIIEARRDRFARVISEPDTGHADALNKGFAASSGEIMGWLNSDDMLHLGCLETVDRVFRARPDVMWITGRPSTMNAYGELTYAGPVRPWSRLRFLSGDHFWIQQESTFWRRELWEAAGGGLDTDYDVANDFELWARFFRHAELHTVDRMLGCFRIRPGQRSVEQSRAYEDEAQRVLACELGALDPAFKAARSDVLPSRPVRLDPIEKAAREAELSRDDPAIIEMADLRGSGEFGFAYARPRHRSTVMVPGIMSTPLSQSLKRNWRFLAALALITGGALIAAIYLEHWRTWIALCAGVGFSLAVTGAVALKTRRIVASLHRSIDMALAAGADKELSRQMLELELDRLRAVTSDQDDTVSDLIAPKPNRLRELDDT